MKFARRLAVALLATIVTTTSPTFVDQQVRANHDGNPTHTTFQPGDVFVGANSGKVEWRLADGTLNKVLDTGAATSETTGMAFDFAGNLYVTAFQANQIFKFDTRGELLGSWGGGYNSHPESIVFNADGNAYVGQADGTRDILEFSPDGLLLRSFDAVTERRGTDWIDLASDQCTLRYTSEGSLIKQIDVCTGLGLQIPDWGTLPPFPNRAFAMRMVGDDTVLVADWADIRWLDAGGATLRTFDAPNQDAWFALNLDPDGQSFWSANYDTGVVHRFDLATGAVLETFTSSSGETSGLAVYGEFTTGAVRSCAAEDLSGTFGQIDPNPANDERVTVIYDARILAEQDAVAIAEGMARKVHERAETSLRHYRDGLDLPIPESVRIEIRCLPHLGPVPVDRPGFVGEPGVVQLRADDIRNELGAAALTGFLAGDAWNDAGAFWKNLVDHELFHTIQYLATDLRVEGANGNFTLIESPASAAQDLFPDVDGIAPTRGSYLEAVEQFTLDLPTAASANPWGSENYLSASILQYWGERFGPQAEPDLQRRVGRFLYTLMGAPPVSQTDDYAATIGYDWAAESYGDADPLAALRDYYLAHYALRAGNVSAAENRDYAILDAEPPADYPDLVLGQENQLDLDPGTNTFTLPADNWSGDVYELRFPGGTSQVALSLDSTTFGAFSTAIVPINPTEEFVLDRELMFLGPREFAPVEKRPQVIGADRLALVFVRSAGPVWGASIELTATPIQGQPGIEFLPPGAHELRTAISGPIVLNVRASVDGQPVTGDLPRSAFGVRIGAVPASVQTVDFRGGMYHIEAWAPLTLGAGTYPLTIEFLDQDFGSPGDLVVDESLPEHLQRVASGGFGELGQGQSASSEATVTPGAQTATFSTTWVGSTFDLTLTSPNDRVITSDSTDADVTVTRTANSVKIAVQGPESGVWQLRAEGTDVPEPEPVTYEVTEADAPLAGSLYVGDLQQAGLPLDVRFSLAEPEGAVVHADVVATVTDPNGVIRRFDLRDDGSGHDSGSKDGVYGAELWATDVAGEYRVDVTARGMTVAGASVERTETTLVTLAAKLDGDGDGVADDAEPRFGLDPAVPSDGVFDHDGDGLTLAEELAAGSDPARWDTDGGRENDRSELAAGRDPSFGADDADADQAALGAEAADGRLVSVSAATASETGSVRLYRLTDSTSTDLGLHPGSGVDLQDGPLPSGAYSYMAVAVTAAGVESEPTIVGPVTVADDVTPPIARITLNQGAWETTDASVPVTFTDLTEPVTEMRLALSEEELTSAPWVPFAAFTAVTVDESVGQHFVHAQVRDAAGNTSSVVSGFVIVVDENPPTSTAGPLGGWYFTDAIQVRYVASDDLAGVDSVELWRRYRPDAGSAWGEWAIGPTATESPITFAFSEGPGFYEFYTIAIDEAGNREDPPPAADAGTVFAEAAPPIARASVSGTGNQANAESHCFDCRSALSADGRYVAFTSSASNLVTGDTNARDDIFVHDRATGETTRASVASDGSEANNASDNPSVSADGRFVVFQSSATNLVIGDTNARVDVFVHDRQTGETQRVSVGPGDTQANNTSQRPAISSDGLVVAFDSAASNLIVGDTNAATDIFVRDLATGTTTRVSVASDGSQGNGVSAVPALSGDGRVVAFQSGASNLVAADTNAVFDIFVHDRDAASTERATLSSSGDQADRTSFYAALDEDGSLVAFASDATTLVSGDTNARSDIFVRDLASGTTSRVSVSADGTQGNGHSDTPKLSADGRYIAFSSGAGNLVPEDPLEWDIFVYDRVAAIPDLVSVAADGTHGDGWSEYPSISADGEHVAFESQASNLVAGDTNLVSDVFVRGLQPVEPDAPPASSAGPLDATYPAATLEVPFTLDDPGSGIAVVELWWRHRSDESGAWTAWALGPTAASSPIEFEFSAGPGFYEFYTIAIDSASMREDPPAAADTATRFAPPPASTVGSLGATYATTALDVPFVINDPGSGVTEVELWWRYRPNAASAWAEWSLGPTAPESPIGFTLSAGPGYYEFYTVAVDAAGSREAAPEVADAATVLLGTVTKPFAFATGLEGWTSSGAQCTGQHSSADGSPAGSLSTTVSGKNRNATCAWTSPLSVWTDWGVPTTATVLSARLDSAGTRVAACSTCQAGSITSYRLVDALGATIATVWNGRSLPAGVESWQVTASQTGQSVGAAWQASTSQLRVVLTANLRTGNAGSATVTLRQDEITLSVTYHP